MKQGFLLSALFIGAWAYAGECIVPIIAAMLAPLCQSLRPSHFPIEISHRRGGLLDELRPG